MKYLLITSMLLTLSCLPKEAGSSEDIEAARVQPQSCGVSFEKNLSLRQIAETAQKIKTECGLSEKKLMVLALKTYN